MVLDHWDRQRVDGTINQLFDILYIGLEVRILLEGTPFSSWGEGDTFALAWMVTELLSFRISAYTICGGEIDWPGEGI